MNQKELRCVTLLNIFKITPTPGLMPHSKTQKPINLFPVKEANRVSLL